MKKWSILTVITALLCMISNCVGLFYTYGGKRYWVENIYGQSVELFGDGIYARDAVLKACNTKGADIAMLLVSIFILVSVLLQKRSRIFTYFQIGGLLCIFYSTMCLILGNSFNRMFLVYLVQGSMAFFTFFYQMTDLLKSDDFSALYQKRLTGTAVFMMIGGSSVLVWMSFILPAIITGEPMENIFVYTTEPTFILDLGFILPFSWICGIGLLKKKKSSYIMVPILLTLIIAVGLCVVMQTFMELSMGIVLKPGQMIGLVGSFIVLGAIAVVLYYRLFKSISKDRIY